MIPTKQLRPHRFLTLRLFLFNLCGLLLAVLMLNNTANSADLLFLGDFETGNIQSPSKNHDGWMEQACYSYSFEPVTSPVRAGTYAMKIFLSQNDSYSCWKPYSNEPAVRARAQIYKDEMKIQYRVGCWLGYSVFIPNDWPSDAEVMIFEYFKQATHSIKSDGTEEMRNR